MFKLTMIYLQVERENMEEGGGSNARRSPRKTHLFGWLPRIFLQALTMTFLAEWGDRSQIATVVMATTEVRLGNIGYVILVVSINFWKMISYFSPLATKGGDGNFLFHE